MWDRNLISSEKKGVDMACNTSLVWEDVPSRVDILWSTWPWTSNLQEQYISLDQAVLHLHNLNYFYIWLNVLDIHHEIKSQADYSLLTIYNKIAIRSWQ